MEKETLRNSVEGFSKVKIDRIGKIPKFERRSDIIEIFNQIGLNRFVSAKTMLGIRKNVLRLKKGENMFSDNLFANTSKRASERNGSVI